MKIQISGIKIKSITLVDNEALNEQKRMKEAETVGSFLSFLGTLAKIADKSDKKPEANKKPDPAPETKDQERQAQRQIRKSNQKMTDHE